MDSAPVSLRKPPEREPPLPGAPLLSAAERRILEALAAAAIPARGRLPGGGAATVERFEGWLREEPPMVANALRALVWTVEMAPLPTHRGRFSRLPADKQLDFLVRWERTESQLWRGAFVGLLTPLKAMHFDAPDVHAALGAPFGIEPPLGAEREPWMANVLDGREAADDDTLECDVVIVGSGAGGGALAYDLAARGHAVLVIEAGRYFKRADFTGRPIETMRRMFLEHGMTVALGNLGAPVWAGCTVGGSTTVNSGTCYRTPERVLAQWRRDLGLGMLTAEGLDGYFERVEQVMGVAEARREYLGSIADVIGRGADRLGYAHGPLHRNAPDCDGQGLCCFGCPTGAKRSADVSWIPGALQRGAMLLSSTRVERIDTDPARGRAIGVTAKTDAGATLTVRAKATVVSGGTLMTPVILMQSGLCTDNRWLGRNLSIHPAAKALARMPERQEMWRGIPQGYTIDQFADEGIMFEGGSLPLAGASTALTAVGPRFSELMESYDHLALFGFMIRDTSRGRIVTRPGSTGPTILYNMNREDVGRLTRGMEILCEVFLEAGAERIVPGITGAPEIRSRKDLEAFRGGRWAPSQFEITAYHPLGTARMGVTPELGVVGPDHETHAVRDLYVVDGAAVPSALGVNPQVTIMALATRAAERLAERLG